MSNRKAQAQQRVIDGVTYTVLPLPGREASAYLNRLIRIVAPGLGVAASALGFGQVEETAVGTGFAGVLDRFPVAEQKAFEDAFAKQTTVLLEDGREPQLSTIFDVHFQGDMGAWLEWFTFCLEVNFAGFFSVLRAKVKAAFAEHAAKLAAAKAKAASSSTSPPASTGESGAS